MYGAYLKVCFINYNQQQRNKLMRKDEDLPKVTNEWGWKFHHLGIPTHDVKSGETYIKKLKFSVSGFGTCPFGVEWMRFEKDCVLPEIIKTVPHLAFVVENLEYELYKHNFNVLVSPNTPSDGLKVAMIEYNGAPIEIMEFSK